MADGRGGRRRKRGDEGRTHWAGGDGERPGRAGRPGAPGAGPPTRPPRSGGKGTAGADGAGAAPASPGRAGAGQGRRRERAGAPRQGGRADGGAARGVPAPDRAPWTGTTPGRRAVPVSRGFPSVTGDAHEGPRAAVEGSLGPSTRGCSSRAPGSWRAPQGQMRRARPPDRGRRCVPHAEVSPRPRLCAREAETQGGWGPARCSEGTGSEGLRGERPRSQGRRDGGRARAGPGAEPGLSLFFLRPRPPCTPAAPGAGMAPGRGRSAGQRVRRLRALGLRAARESGAAPPDLPVPGAPGQVGSQVPAAVQSPGARPDPRASPAATAGRAVRGACWARGGPGQGEASGTAAAPAGASHQSRVTERAKAWLRERPESSARQSQPGSGATGSPGGPSRAKRRLGWTWRCSQGCRSVSRGAMWSARLSGPREVGRGLRRVGVRVCRPTRRMLRVQGRGARKVFRAAWHLAQALAVLWSVTRRTGSPACVVRGAAGGRGPGPCGRAGPQRQAGPEEQRP